MDLLTCLQTSPYRHLTAISRALGLSCNTRTPKADFARQLRDHLANPVVLQWTREGLSAEEQNALRSLVAHNGRMPLRDFTRAFGPVRPYRPWRRDEPAHPWRHPISTTEKLLYEGLIYLTPSDPQRRQPRHVILPTEFLTLISPNNSPANAHPPPPLPYSLAPSPPRFDPLLDLALFLSYLQGADVRPLHGRWLSPSHLWALGSCLSPPYPCQGIRSELQADRIAFTHYLAESLGLVVSASHQLKPSPSALSWLSQPRSTQLRALWETWLSPTDENRERWTRYRLFGQNLRDPPGFVQRLAHLLAAFPANVGLALTELAQSPHLGLDELIPWWERDQGHLAPELLQEVLEGPLSWLGLISGLPDRGSATCAEPGRSIRNPKPVLSGAEVSEIRRWSLTSLGRWLLGHSEASPPEDASQPLILVDDLVLTLPPRSQLPGLLALAEWTEMSPGPQLRLTPTSVTRALERGGDAQDLLAALARFTTPPLTPEQRATLQSWVQRATPRFSRPQSLAVDCQIHRHTAGSDDPAGANCDVRLFSLLASVEVTQRSGPSTLASDPPCLSQPLGGLLPGPCEEGETCQDVHRPH